VIDKKIGIEVMGGRRCCMSSYHTL